MTRRDQCRDLGLRQSVLRALSGLDQTTVNEWLQGRPVNRSSAARLGRCLEGARLARAGEAASMHVSHYAFGARVVSAFPDEPLPGALERMFVQGISHQPVRDGHGEVLGWLSVARVAEQVGKGELRTLRRARVREAMEPLRSHDQAPLDAGFPLVKAAALVADDRARLVVRDGRLVGIFTATDAAKPVFLGGQTGFLR